MGEIPSSKNTKSFLDGSIIAVLTVAANHVLPDAQPSETTTAIPSYLSALPAAVLPGTSAGYLAYKQLVELETRWLNAAIAERKRPGLPRKEVEELAADIAKRRKALQELQRENM